MLTRFFRKFLLTFAIVPILLTQPALAHVVWFNYEDGQYELLFGHPESNSPEPLTPSKFKEATAYNSSKGIVATDINIEDGRLFVDPQGKIAALTAFYDNGFYVQDPDGSFENISQEQAEAVNYENVSNFVKYTKGLYGWSDTLATPFGLPLEIIPLQNPFEVKAGETLPIQVLFNGSLITTPLVEYLGQTVSVDASGIALIPVGVGGLQVIEASYDDLTSTNPAVSYAATLSAQVVPVPEPSLLMGFAALGLVTLVGKRQKS